jgi:hypothetical protein
MVDMAEKKQDHCKHTYLFIEYYTNIYVQYTGKIFYYIQSGQYRSYVFVLN